jgi:hypothetical protein
METATGLGRKRDIEMMERVRQLVNVAGRMVQETRLASDRAGAETTGLAMLLWHIVGSSSGAQEMRLVNIGRSLWAVQETLLVNSGRNSRVVLAKLRESTADSWLEAQARRRESIVRNWTVVVVPARLRDTDRGTVLLAAVLAKALCMGYIVVVVPGTLLCENHSAVLEARERQLGRLADVA